MDRLQRALERHLISWIFLMTTGSKAPACKVCLWTLIAQEANQKVTFLSEHLDKPVGILGERTLPDATKI